MSRRDRANLHFSCQMAHRNCVGWKITAVNNPNIQLSRDPLQVLAPHWAVKTAKCQCQRFHFSISGRLRLLEGQIMNRKGVLSEPHGPRPDSQETSPLLNTYSDHFHVASHSENAGGSAVDGAALRRNEQDGKNIVHKSSLHVLRWYLKQRMMGRRMITSLKTDDNWVRSPLDPVELELNDRSHFVGLFSATILIFNGVTGSGWVVVNLWNWQWTRTDRLWNRIYATPSNILRSSGSVGVSLIMWLVGALIAACGTTVHIELGTVCIYFFWLNPITGPCLYFLSRDFLGAEARRITSNTFTVVPNSWWRVFLPFTPS